MAPELARRLDGRARAAGIGLIDAGVSPGGAVIAAGRSSIFVGGADDVVAQARPYLEALGRVAHLGPVGRGLEAKLLNNLTLTAGYGLAVSILALAEKLGFDPEELRQAFLVGSAQSFAMQAVRGVLRPQGRGATGTYQSMHDLLKKDVDHTVQLAGPGGAELSVLLSSAQAVLDMLKSNADREDEIRRPG